MKTRNRAHFIALLAANCLLITSCAKQGPPPVAFVDSPVFAELEKRAYGILKGDPESIVVVKTDAGYVPERYTRDENGLWAKICAGPTVNGEDLDTLRWIEMERGRLLLMVASAGNPDVLTQNVILLDAASECAVRYKERLRLPVPGEVIGPGSVPGGVSVATNGIRIVDKPKLVRLEGADGEVGLLMGVRDRRIQGTSEHLYMGRAARRFLLPRAVTVRWRASLPGEHREGIDLVQEGSVAANAPAASAVASAVEPDEKPPAAASKPRPLTPLDLPELRDENHTTSFAIRASQAGTLVIEADAPVQVLELHHGCADAVTVPLRLHLGERDYVTGRAPPSSSFVRASGRGHQLDDGSWRDLFVLRNASAVLELDVVAEDAERCIRHVRAFGFGKPPRQVALLRDFKLPAR